MVLSPGTRLGPYVISAPIGAGGMGEVYRATDTNLGRQVAIKVLPEAFASDPERLARFEREAKTLAALNHPNIAQIYGLEKADGIRALVMELVEGPTLADRVAQGPTPIDDALGIAKQTAEALEAAHEQGIIHRDLKPANIKVRDDGTVKVLDFGLAKLAETGTSAVANAALSNSPTITSPAMMTGAGVILGTAAYMSPEQARGKAVDKRTDIWAFGCVLYEMLAGKRAFQGEDISDVYVAIMRDEPDWNALPMDTPPTIRRLLRRALAKDPKLRFREAGSAIVEIEEALTFSDLQTRRPSPTSRLHFWRRPWAAAAVVLLVAVATGVTVWSLAGANGAPAQVVRFSIPYEDDATLFSAFRRVVAISPDGSRVAYVANQRIYLRQLDQVEATPIRGTEVGTGGGSSRGPFFSPDGQWIGFWADRALKRIAVGGGAAVTLCPTDTPALGAWWGEDGTILFGQAQSGIWRVPANGGRAEVLIKVNDGELAASPQPLPGGEWVLFTLRPKGVTNWNQAQIVLQSLTSGQRIVAIDRGRDGRYLPTGHLVYALSGVLYAVPFDLDARQVSGGAVSMVEDVGDAGNFSSDTHFSVAANGALVFATGGIVANALQTFVWVDRSGRETPVPARARPYQEFNLSPDGTRLAVRVQDPAPDIWIYDFVRQTETRLTFDPGIEVFPTWTPDGRRIAFGGSGFALSWRAADGTGTAEILAESREEPNRVPQAFSPDGKVLVFERRRQGEGAAVFSPLSGAGSISLGWVALDGAQTLTAVPAAPGSSQRNAVLSPDGRWLTYESDESGTIEVYVRPFPDVNAGRWQLSSGGGRWPAWPAARGGRELFYVGPNGLMIVAITPTQTFTPGAPMRLFETARYVSSAGMFATSTANVASNRRYAVASDGQRFLFLKAASSGSEDDASRQLMFVGNWFEELKRRVPVN